MSQYPDYVPLKNLEDTNTFSIPDEGLSTSKQLTEEDQKKQLGVVDIHFCFDQHNIIELLEKRGPILDRLDAEETKDVTFEELKKVDKEIDAKV